MDASLEKIGREIDALLAEAARSRHSPMHTPVVSTPDGDLRIMVLRTYDPRNRTLRFHTDLRSPKVAQLEGGATIGVLFYDRERKVQIRCRGRARIESDTPLASQAWEESTAFARRCYLGAAPGEIREGPSSGLPAEVEGRLPSEEDLLPSRANFAVLLVEIRSIDWYHLANSGHRRALFKGNEACWLTP